jgi:hypothetical protein
MPGLMKHIVERSCLQTLCNQQYCSCLQDTERCVCAAQTPGSSQQLASQIHDELRANLLHNIVAQHEETGYLWENYKDDTGQGQGSHPFTGWTALIVLIAAQAYFNV